MDLPKELKGRLYSERGAVVHSEVNSVIKTDHGKYLLVVKSLNQECPEKFKVQSQMFEDGDFIDVP